MTDHEAASRATGPVHRAFALLQLVVAADRPIGVRDLARRSGLSSSTTGRMLGILTELGMVERTPDGAAAPGAGLATLTTNVATSAPLLRERLRPLTVALRDRYGENAAVCVDDGDALLYLDSSRVAAAVQVPDPVGDRFDFHLVAPGLVAMADWPAARLRRHLRTPLRTATAHSVTDGPTIRRRVRGVAADGFAWTDQELDLEVNGLAAPVRDRAGELVAIATLYGPSYRLQPQRRPDLGADLAAFVAMLGTELLSS